MNRDQKSYDIIHQAHQIFESDDLWGVLKGQDNIHKKALVILLKGKKLINKETHAFNKKLPKDSWADYLDSDRMFYDAVYGFIVDDHEISHCSIGGWLLSTLTALGVLCELSSQLEMYLEDDEIATISDNTYTKRILK